jgi:hypothetical protein
VQSRRAKRRRVGENASKSHVPDAPMQCDHMARVSTMERRWLPRMGDGIGGRGILQVTGWWFEMSSNSSASCATLLPGELPERKFWTIGGRLAWRIGAV